MDSGVRQFNVQTLERPLLPVGIHTDGDARTCSQRRQQQLVWVWSDVSAAYRDRFISVEQMRADRYALRVPQSSSFDDNTSAHESLPDVTLQLVSDPPKNARADFS